MMKASSGESNCPSSQNVPKSSLFERLDAFLPAIASANKELEGPKTSHRETIIQINDLSEQHKNELNEHSDYDSDNNVKETFSHSSDATTRNGAQTQIIEMDISIGNMKSNLLYNSLLNENDKDDNDNKIKKNESELDVQADGNEENGIGELQSKCRKIICVSGTTDASNSETVGSKPDHLEVQPVPETTPIFMTEISSKRRKI